MTTTPKNADAESRRAWEDAERATAAAEAALRTPKPREDAPVAPPRPVPVSLVELDPGVAPAAILALQGEATHVTALVASLRALNVALGPSGDTLMILAFLESYLDALAAGLVGLRRVETQRAVVAGEVGREVRDRVLGRIRTHVQELGTLGRALRREPPAAAPKA